MKVINKKRLLIGGIVSVLAISFLIIYVKAIRSNNEKIVVSIEEIKEPKEVKVQPPLKPDQYVHNLKVLVRGNINDTAVIGNVKLLPGKVDTVIYNHDWYAPDYELEYKPYKATEGSLKVDLTFSYTD